MKAARRLVIDDGDTSTAIMSLLGTMPAADQAALLADLAPAPARNLDEQIAAAPVEVMERLAVRHFSRSALRRRRLDARDEDFRELARRVIADGGPIEGAPLAREVLRRAARYAGDAWPRERSGPEPADPQRAILWRILRSSAGSKMPAVPQIVRILMGDRTP
jgi:hypothetical protein